MREATERELARWPEAPRVRRPPEHAGDHARGDPARGLRRHRPGAPGAAARAAARPARGDHVDGPAGVGDVRAPQRRSSGCARWRGRSTRCCSRRSRPRRARAGRRHLLAARRGALRDGSAMDDREIRDQLMTLLIAGHETTATGARVVARPAHPPPGRAGAAPATGGEAYLRAVVAESLRLRPVVPLAGRRLAVDLTRQRPHAPGRHRRHAVDLARAHARRRSTRSRTRSGPSASSTARRRPTPGSRSAAACAAASAPPSRSSRCASCWSDPAPASTCARPAAGPSASRAATSRSRRATARG